MTSAVRWLPRGGSVLLLTTLVLAGCQSVESSDEDELRVFLVWYDDEGTRRELAGVELCQIDRSSRAVTSNCDETDQTGQASIFLPRGELISYSLTKEGFASFLYANVTDADFENVNAHTMFTIEQIDILSEPLDAPWPIPGAGSIVLGASSLFGPVVGATIELVGEPTQPFYLDEDGVLSYVPTASTGSELSGSFGGFVGVLPGEYEVEFGVNAQNCHAERAWPVTGPNRVRVPVKAEHISFANVSCRPEE